MPQAMVKGLTYQFQTAPCYGNPHDYFVHIINDTMDSHKLHSQLNWIFAGVTFQSTMDSAHQLLFKLPKQLMCEIFC